MAFASRSLRVTCLAFLVALGGACRQRPPTPPSKPPVDPGGPNAATGFDNLSNGVVTDATHREDLAAFDDVEQIADGLGPLYNAQSCRECHQNPTSGGPSQVSELRVGHVDSAGQFRNPDIPIARGAVVISGRTLVNDRAICPNATFPDSEIQERVPDTETIRTTRLSLNLLGDGLVEALADQTLLELAREQRRATRGQIHGQALWVPILEAPGHTALGRFGWKDQHASLLSFAGDAYVNEMGLTSRLFPDEVTDLCNTADEPNNKPDSTGLEDIDRFARFMRATKAPARDRVLATTPQAMRGSVLFDSIGCALCHVPTLTTVPAGSAINGGTFMVPPALGDKVFHPFGDFLLHDVGTGDGIAIAMAEHYGRRVYDIVWKQFVLDSVARGRNKIRTAPLWGVRLRPRLMHDGVSLTFRDAILRHGGEASEVTRRFRRLAERDKAAVAEFLKSL